MEIISLASSSKGNCYLISDSNSTLLLECGITPKKVQEILHDLSKIDGCLITHEHSDHSRYFKDFLKYTKIYASEGTLKALNEKYHISQSRKILQSKLVANKSVGIGSFTVIPFETQHDAEDPFGYLLYSKITKEKLLFATDTYYIKNQFRGLNYIMVECNYANDLLREDLTKTERLRLLQSHFELENVKKFLLATDLSKCKVIYLLHLSPRNSDEKRFKREIEELTGIPVIVCKE